jgi:hypothetical protein
MPRACASRCSAWDAAERPKAGGALAADCSGIGFLRSAQQS